MGVHFQNRSVPALGLGPVSLQLVETAQLVAPGEVFGVAVGQRLLGTATAVAVAPPKLDAQGRSRIYLKDATAKAKAQGAPDVTIYAASMAVEGKACGA